jgi:hypothetical protein
MEDHKYHPGVQDLERNHEESRRKYQMQYGYLKGLNFLAMSRFFLVYVEQDESNKIQAYPDRPMTIEGLDSPTYPYRN